MGWSGSLTENSAIGASITYTPDSPESTAPSSKWVNVKTYAGNYSTSVFTAPKRGIYKFTLKGSGGAKISVGSGDSYSDGTMTTGGASGGTGGTTVGYLRLEAGETVYVGAGGVCRAAFVSTVNGASLAAIAKEYLLFVAGAGGSGGAWSDCHNWTGYGCSAADGGNGGGSSGVAGTKNSSETGGKGGSQSAGGAAGTTSAGSGSNKANGSAGAYGVGGEGSLSTRPSNGKLKGYGGRGGDGYYGGGGGASAAYDGSCSGAGGGAGSGYVKTATLTVIGKTYTSTTSQGGGAAANGAGSVVVTYYARADLPVNFNGTTLERIIFNGVDIQSLIFNGTKLFFERIKGRVSEWFTSTKAVRRSRVMI